MYCLQDYLQYYQSDGILKIGHVDFKHQKSYYLYYLSMKKAYTFIISFYSSQFPSFFTNQKLNKSELWNIFSNILSRKNRWKNSPQLHSIRAWGSFDKGPALSITTLRCLRGAVMHPPRRGRRNIHSRAWPQRRGSP